MLSHIDYNVDFVRENFGPYAVLWSKCPVGEKVCAVIEEDHDEDVHGAFTVLVGGRLEQRAMHDLEAPVRIWTPGETWRGRGRRKKGEYCQTRLDADTMVIQVWLRAPRINNGVPTIYPEGEFRDLAAGEQLTLNVTDLAVVVTEGLIVDGITTPAGEVVYAETRPLVITGPGKVERMWVPEGYDFSALGIAVG